MRTLLTILLLSIALAASGQSLAIQVEAGTTEKTTPQALSVMQSNGDSLSQAVEQVQRQYNGKIVSAETQVSGNRETHVIRVLTADSNPRPTKARKAAESWRWNSSSR